MKFWEIAIVLLIVLVLAFLMTHTIDEAEQQVGESARERAARESFWDISEVKVVTVKGHEYIIVNGSNRGGIVHSESCPCKKDEVAK